MKTDGLLYNFKVCYIYVCMHVQEAESVLAAQVALTVRDSIYYIGHGNVSLSRLHLNFLTSPPRTLRLAAPHKTEVRRVMMSMRRCFPSMHQRVHEPSGYIVDISRDNQGEESGQSGERRTTRAVVNRSRLNVGGGMPGYGGMFGPMLVSRVQTVRIKREFVQSKNNKLLIILLFLLYLF